MKKNIDDFIREASGIHNNKYDYSKTNYIKTKMKIEIICPIHGSFWQTPNNHLSQKQGCPKCGGTKKITTEEFISKANLSQDYLYNYSKSNYVNNKTKIEIICDKHGSFWQTPQDHLKGSGCPKCKGWNKTTKEFINEAVSLHGNIYNYSKTNYIKSSSKVEIICDKHGSFWQTPNNHLRGAGCGKCKNKSKGEYKIEKILIENNISFYQQQTFDNCRYKGLLKFDFYLPALNFCIEYDGIQHFESFNYFGGEKKLKETKKRDGIKNNYCKNNNINLLRIKYNESILEKLQVLL